MRIQHNIMAMNAYRNLGMNNKSLSANLEKLSSGYKINRAGDDAAGLAISEKMRAQITSLDAAQKNVSDGISLVKTAEGAMQEIQDMLNRMEYLATQSANGTYDNEVDRDNLQKEVTALQTEIDRIAKASNFNGTKLLDGSLAASHYTAGTAEAATAVDTSIAGLATGSVKDKLTDIQGASLAVGGVTVDLSEVTGTDDASIKASIEAAVNAAFADENKTNADGDANYTKLSDATVTFAAGKFTVDFKETAMTYSEEEVGGLRLQIGDTSDDYNQMSVKVGNMHTEAMGTMDEDGNVEDGKSIKDVDISTQQGAADAVEVIKDAINYVSGVRGDLGALQNRLEHTNNNLAVMEENIQDAESTIRDTDIADEMMAYTKNNILIQSAQAMLAQANQVPQGVLQLMQ